MAPPRPPLLCAMRRTASREQRKGPTTLISRTRRRASGSTSATSHCGPVIPALLTRPSSGPRDCSTVSNIAFTAPSSETSARTAMARPPAETTSAATFLRLVFIPHVVDADGVAAPPQKARGCGADSPAGPGHESITCGMVWVPDCFVDRAHTIRGVPTKKSPARAGLGNWFDNVVRFFRRSSP